MNEETDVEFIGKIVGHRVNYDGDLSTEVSITFTPAPPLPPWTFNNTFSGKFGILGGRVKIHISSES